MTRRVVTIVSAGALILTAGSATADSAPHFKPGGYQIDPAHTYAHFEIDHMGLSTMRGRMDVEDGRIQIAGDPSNSRISVTLDPASVDTGNDARDEHLRDMDGFFNVQKYPSIKFESTAVHFDDDDPDEATVEGKLTLHGVTRAVTLDVDDIACRINPLEKTRYTCGFSAETEIRRSDFAMNAYSKLVGDEVDLSIEAEAYQSIDSSS